MIRSDMKLIGISFVDRDGETRRSVKILSPKHYDRCAFCRDKIIKRDWYSVALDHFTRHFYCGIKCMWIASRNGYRQFDRYSLDNSIITYKPIKQTVPRSLKETTSTLKPGDIDTESTALHDTTNKLIGREINSILHSMPLEPPRSISKLSSSGPSNLGNVATLEIVFECY